MTNLIVQFVKFGIVGIVATAIDFGALILLTERVGIDPVLSAGISFIASVTFNYFASMRFVFKRREDLSRSREVAIFFLLSLAGLGINELLMWTGVNYANLNYLLVKLATTIVVTLWNFFSRKKWLDSGK